MQGLYSAQMLASTPLLNLFTTTSSLIAGPGLVNFAAFSMDLFFSFGSQDHVGFTFKFVTGK